MKNHKYKIGCWVRFYANDKLVIAVVLYLAERQAGDQGHIYYTDHGVIDEESIIECRYP